MRRRDCYSTIVTSPGLESARGDSMRRKMICSISALALALLIAAPAAAMVEPKDQLYKELNKM